VFVVRSYVAPTVTLAGEKDAVTVGSFGLTVKPTVDVAVPPGPLAVTVQLVPPTWLGPITSPTLPLGVAKEPLEGAAPVQT
jgi:hypothetical protein